MQGWFFITKRIYVSLIARFAEGEATFNYASLNTVVQAETTLLVAKNVLVRLAGGVALLYTFEFLLLEPQRKIVEIVYFGIEFHNIVSIFLLA